jgi:hypothetical protein
MDVHCATDPPTILYPWSDDEIQSTDPFMNFFNPDHDGFRGPPDGPPPELSDVYNPHPDGTRYKEYMHSVDKDRHRKIGEDIHDAIRQVRNTLYEVSPCATSEGLWYLMAGCSKDYVISRHLKDQNLSKVDAFLLEWGPHSEWGNYYRFQPPYEDPPGLDLFTPVMLDVSAGLMALCASTRRIPICGVEPTSLDFGGLPVKSSKRMYVELHNQGTETVLIDGITIHETTQRPQYRWSLARTSVRPGQSEVISVKYSPRDELEALALLHVVVHKRNETFQDLFRVGLQGYGQPWVFWVNVKPERGTITPRGNVRYTIKVVAQPHFTESISFQLLVNDSRGNHIDTIDAGDLQPPYPRKFDYVLRYEQVRFPPGTYHLCLRGKGGRQIAEDHFSITVRQ